jgi:alkylation response protein AidB-like acyl-CoA dehydrogenase
VRLYVFNHFAESIERGERGEMALGRPINAYATEVAVRCAEFAYKVMGGESVYESSPVQRYLRDVLAAQQHVAASDVSFALYGKASLDAASTQ